MKTPKYKRPPVVETVIGVQFPELLRFRAAHFGRYWAMIADRFPKADDQGRLPPAEESFPRRPPIPGTGLRMMKGGTPERAWFTAESDAELIQVQPDRFLFNWRRCGSDPYPSYDTNIRRFHDKFDEFRRFCKTGVGEEPEPNLCEVTYVNHIFPREDESAVQLMGTLFVGVRWDHADDFLPKPESATLNRVYVIPPNAGRLYAEASIAAQLGDPQRSEFIRLTLTARVRHPRKEASKLSDTIDLAHEWVVCGFASLTESGIQHERWERTT